MRGISRGRSCQGATCTPRSYAPVVQGTLSCLGCLLRRTLRLVEHGGCSGGHSSPTASLLWPPYLTDALSALVSIRTKLPSSLSSDSSAALTEAQQRIELPPNVNTVADWTNLRALLTCSVQSIHLMTDSVCLPRCTALERPSRYRGLGTSPGSAVALCIDEQVMSRAAVIGEEPSRDLGCLAVSFRHRSL